MLAALEGDIKLEWDPSNATEVENCRKFFEDKKKEGYYAYRMKKLGGQGERIYEFDKDAERIIIVKPIVGG